MNCKFVGCDGEKSGLVRLSINIWEWQGTSKIVKLSAFPLEYHPSVENTNPELIRRGKIFESLSGYHYKYYQGIAVGQGPWGPIKYNVNSRIIIDTYAWNRFNLNRQVSLNALEDHSNRSSAYQVSDSEDEDEDGDYSDEYDEIDEDSADKDAAGSQSRTVSLTKDQLLLCGFTLRGFSLKNKKWLTFSTDAVKDITYNEGAFQSLVLPEDHKELVLAMAESQRLNREAFDDVVQGKGKGMIMLLSGPPGVGKTMTAEAVAEVMRSPLYMLSAGDLGTDLGEVETSLSNVLEMATKWNAILLIDEADVFLEQRSSHELERNKLVSIFLRIFEY